MKITIDNHNGAGVLDYTQTVAAAGLQLERKLNEPGRCIVMLDCNVLLLPVPTQYGRIIVASDGGVVLFTGYVAQVPEAVFAGTGVSGMMYAQKVTAVSDEYLLDQQSVPAGAGSTNLLVGNALLMLTQRVDATRFTVQSGSMNSVGSFAAEAAYSWSKNAGELAASARASYRVISGQVSLEPIGATTHTLSDAAGSLDVGALSLSQSKVLANDFTVCGESEAQVYVNETFQGDGTTTAFELTRRPLIVTGRKSLLIADSFSGPAVNPLTWKVTDPGSRMTLSSAGLSVNGGNGLDGQTTLIAMDNVEMGGSLVLIAGGVQCTGSSDGYINCLYSGIIAEPELFAGFHIKQSTSGTVVIAVMSGAETGASVPLTLGRAYTFRLRYHCKEQQRVTSTYYVTGTTGPQAYGGSLLAAGADLVLEVQDTTGGINQTTVVLYDGHVTNAPATCVLAAINSPAFTGSVQSVELQQNGSLWVSSVQLGGSGFTRRLGLATIGADCRVTTAGRLEFYATSIPQAGELITVSYRTAGVSVARLANEASIAALSSAVVPGVSRWIGSVTAPRPRSSADCENAALALLSIATTAGAAWAGKYAAVNMQQSGDVWPGDQLALQTSEPGGNALVVVRKVNITSHSAVPELLEYAIDFANDWSVDLSVKTSAVVPKGVWLPQAAAALPLSVANVAGISSTVTSSQIAINAGMTPPTGGGFEVRRVDWQFGSGSDGTLVMRSASAAFSIPREAAIEQYFLRMYDASTPPNYSRFSTEICASVPL